MDFSNVTHKSTQKWLHILEPKYIMMKMTDGARYLREIIAKMRNALPNLGFQTTAAQ